METLVETFIERQEQPMNDDEIDNYNKTVIDLGLEHLTVKKGSRAIEPMGDLEIAVYRTLCPKQINIKEYSYNIPLRVLEAYKKALSFLEEKYPTDSLETKVWVDQEPDPVLIIKRDWSNHYLVGRWGNELQDFPTLLRRAKEKGSSKIQEELMRAKNYVELWEKDPESFKMAHLLGNIKSIYF